MINLFSFNASPSNITTNKFANPDTLENTYEFLYNMNPQFFTNHSNQPQNSRQVNDSFELGSTLQIKHHLDTFLKV